ncbi:MAG: glycosyltransferase [Deltaproteobacteria bacterium]|jgi:glycosyltransferase involved in cell wall biosynthesis|nr:glycosyltransferase [Deltaproteobacteria bacterium]MDL1988437.1 glycosyltransferase [Deltaproteobacteria bacterium]
MPKVSIVIPTYNRAWLLRKAILSVLNQTYQDFEIIVVDDASNDNTIDVISALNDKRIKYIRHDVNKGEAGARNTGILNTNGQYIAFLDDDDEWLPKKLELQVNKLENSPQKTGLIYTSYIRCYYKEKKLIRKHQSIALHKGEMYHILIKRNIIGPPSCVLIRRKCMEKIGLFDSAIAYGLDYDYWIRISKHFDVEYLAEPLVKYRVHENRLSNNIELRAQGARDLAKKYGKKIIASNYWRSIYLFLGIELCNKGEMIEGIKAMLESIRHCPTRKISYFYLGISLLGFSNFKRAMVLKKKLRPYFSVIKERLTKLF